MSLEKQNIARYALLISVNHPLASKSQSIVLHIHLVTKTKHNLRLLENLSFVNGFRK